jgi:tRNA (mo5U34)-methyltransferase
MMSDLQAKIDAIPFWYHKIELPGGIVTPGYLPHDPAQYRVPKNLIGKRVLDVGAWDGYWTFEALRRGATEVVAIDDFSDNLGNSTLARPAWETFDLCAKALEYGEDCVTRREMSVYDVSPETLGMFDIVFFFGTLYHLRHPLLALDKLASVCTGEIFVESAILDDYSPYRGGLGHGYPGQQMVMEFYPNWWSPTLLCLGQMVRAAGFTDVNVWKLMDKPTDATYCRGFVNARRA